MQSRPSTKTQPISPFKPAWWLKNAHLQTILAKYLAPKRALHTIDEMLELPDGDELQLNWLQSNAAAQAPIALVLHGLEGNLKSHYVRGMLQALQQQGFRVLLMHFRGCHGAPNKTPRAYHSGDTEDLAAVIAHVQQRYPNAPLCAVGFSLGGNVLAKYCGETGAHNPLFAAAVVSAPLMLAACARKINQGFSKVYQNYLLGRLKRSMTRKLQAHRDFPLPLTPEKIQATRSIREFDEILTAPLHGFRDADDYYRRASAKPLLAKVQIPLLLIHALDDPFLDDEVVPDAQQLPPQVQLLLSQHGGHVGFVAGGAPWRPVYWLDKVVPAYLWQQHTSSHASSQTAQQPLDENDAIQESALC